MATARAKSRRRYVWGGVVLVVVVVLVLVVVTQVRANAEAKKHDSHGVAATAARTRTDEALTAALDNVAAQLSLGASLGPAVFDTCRAARPTSMDFSITCDRERYRAYRIPTGVDAHSMARRLGPPWRLDDSFCDADLKLDTVCLQGTDLALELVAEPASKDPHGTGLSRWPQIISTTVESSGFDSLKVTDPVVFVEASSTYYVG